MKLLYYMQGFHLAFFNAPFFNESIKAWTYGPVVPVVFQEFKRYKQRAINAENYHDELRTFFLTQIDRSEPFQTDEYGRIVLTENMREAVRKAEQSLADGTCLTEEMFLPA